MVTFNHPAFLVLALCLIPGFLLISALVRRFHKNAIGRFGQRETLSRFSRFSPKTTTTLLFTLSLASLAIAAAEPSLSSSEDGSTRTLNAIIVLDVSRSMLAEDGLEDKSRLAAGIESVEKLFETYPDGRFGLVLYTNQVLVYQPTFDHAALRTIMDDIRQNYPIRGEGSDPLAALDAAAKLIGELPYTVNTVFFISDGGKSLAASAIAPQSMTPITKTLRQLRVHLVAVGVGKLVPSAIPVYQDGVLIGYHEFEGQIAYTALDETLLTRIAEETAGTYLRLADPDDLVRLVQSKNLDSQPIAQDSSANLVWLMTAVSILLVLVSLVNPRS